MEVTIGGNRVGSGKKMQAHLHNYNRSTHNLSETFASSLAPGVLYPALCKLAMRGDSFDIAINADCRTIPTVGPLFGSYKMQVDVYQCPVRLYQAILHNNPLAIGLKMQQVKFPVLNIETTVKATGDMHECKTNESSLAHYLGLSGLGTTTNAETEYVNISRQVNALPFLSYYDIYKTYYANKQEEKAYIITAGTKEVDYGVRGSKYIIRDIDGNHAVNYASTWSPAHVGVLQFSAFTIEFKISNYLDIVKKMPFENILEIARDTETYTYTWIDLFNLINNDGSGDKLLKSVTLTEPDAENNQILTIRTKVSNWNSLDVITVLDTTVEETTEEKLKIEDFNLSFIDDMRYDLLSYHTLGSAFTIEAGTTLPYNVLVDTGKDGISLNSYPMNGLVLKTYQNDIFNNWLNTEWIEGENSITEMSKVAIVDGSFSMDALNFAQKMYNMLNRIAVAGATYEDWQDVVYEEVKRRQIESPIFVGGMSQEVIFDEIIQNAPAQVDGQTSVLGDLGGRGKLAGNKKGGKLHIKCDEACFIIAIVSLTPRVYYTQGNEFYLTDVFSLDDVHKPPMDGIGFQDLIGERLAWWDTKIDASDSSIEHRSKIGKLPAWIEYMTSYDRAHGDFATEAAGYMILSRRYETGENFTIKDATTYIDPQKYNYAFAYKNLDAQNFWVQIGFNIKARRLMSARLIPNV